MGGIHLIVGARGCVVVEDLCYKPESHGLCSDEVDSNLPNPSGCTVAMGFTQPLTEMSTRNLKKETWG
jgi:hypothetical protein